MKNGTTSVCQLLSGVQDHTLGSAKMSPNAFLPVIVVKDLSHAHTHTHTREQLLVDSSSPAMTVMTGIQLRDIKSHV